MCTYSTERSAVDGSAKGPNCSRFHVTDPAHGPSARVAIELTAGSARALVAAIQAALTAAPRL